MRAPGHPRGGANGGGRGATRSAPAQGRQASRAASAVPLRSTQNAAVKYVARLQTDAGFRRSEGLFVVEGPKALSEAAARLGAQAIEAVYVAEDAAGIARPGLPAPVPVAPAAFRRMADTRTPQGVLAVVRRPRANAAADLWRAAGPVVALAGLQDPGNVGAVLRAAAAFAAAGAVLGPGTADPWGPKALRGAMGAVFSLRVAETANLAVALAEARAAGRRVLALDPQGAPLDELLGAEAAGMPGEAGAAAGGAPGAPEADAPSGPPSGRRRGSSSSGGVVLVLGNEGHGLPPDVVSAADARARIPHAAGMESLNVATAAAVALYEVRRAVAAWQTRL